MNTKKCRKCGYRRELLKCNSKFHPSGATRWVCLRCGDPGNWLVPKTEAHIRDLAERAQMRKEVLRQQNRQKRITRGIGIPGHCDICGAASEALHWDHDHRTGAYRGHICHGCNAALGFAKDDPWRLRLLADYLERHTLPQGATG